MPATQSQSSRPDPCSRRRATTTSPACKLVDTSTYEAHPPALGQPTMKLVSPILILALYATAAFSDCILTFNDFKCGNGFETDQSLTFASNASFPSACLNLDWPPTALLPAGSCTSDFQNITVFDSRDCMGRSVMVTYNTGCTNPMFFIRSVIVMADPSTIG